jgi:lipid A 4'-phosphatase
MNPASINKVLVSLLLVLVLSSIVFTVFPAIDILVSSLFYRETEGFWLDNHLVLTAYRNTFNYLSMSLAVLSLILWGVSVRRELVFGVPGRVWAFITFLYILGPGLLVNGVLKAHSGRARPVNVEAFGGEKNYTPVFDFADQCEKNCSFVSGEGSSATAFFISILVLSAYVPYKPAKYAILIVAFAAATSAAALRILKGRHFLSDTIFSVLFVSLIAVLLSWLLLRRKPGT